MQAVIKKLIFKVRPARLLPIVAIIGLVFINSTKPVHAFAGGDGTAGNPYQIATVADLLELNSYSGSSHVGKYFKMTNDIDLNVAPYNTGTGWTPISSFYGHFDGDGYTISNLYINTSSGSKGLFASLYGASEFKNVNLVNAYVKGGETVAVLAGYAGSNRSFSNITIQGTSIGSGVVAGVIGNVGSASTFDDIQADVAVTGTGFAGFGGLFAYATGATITNSSSTGSITGGSYRAGGLVGSADQNTTISRSYATGNVSSTGEIGGLVGALYGTISDSYSRGSVTSGSTSKGSFVGFMNQSTSSITNSYSTGAVVNSGGQGFLGSLYSGLGCTNSFYDTQTTGKSTTACTATGKTTAQLKDVATFTDTATTGLTSAWDFSGNPNDDIGNNNYWRIDPLINDGYPYLAWQDGLSPPTVETNSATNVTLDSAQLNGELIDEGTATVTRRGFVSGVSSQVSPGSAEPEDSGYDSVWDDDDFALGTFSTTLSSLSEGAMYYYRAFAQSDDGITYGDEVSFTTLSDPTINSPTASELLSVLDLEYTSTSTAIPGSVQLFLDGVQDYTIILNTESASSHSISIDPKNVGGSPSVSASSSNTIEEGTYNITLSYSELLSDESLSASVSSILIDPNAPTHQSFVPADNADGVAIDAQLGATFSEPLFKQTGDITIYNASDDSVHDTIDVATGAVTGNGTDTITITPAVAFEPGNDYYVQIDNGALEDEAGNAYAGFADETTWDFTALDPPQMLCEQPTATHESIAGSCTTEPEGWGVNTWEARYKVATDAGYTNITLADESQAEATVTGLDPETNYWLEFRFTNEWGTSDWGRLEITTEEDPDDDNDGQLDVDEDAGPNDGDANDDGIADSQQANVIGYENPVSGDYAVFEASCGTVTNFQVGGESSEDSDDGYNYPGGLASFWIECDEPGETTTIRQYYYGIEGNEDFTVRKWVNDQYVEIENAQILGMPVDDDILFLVQYQITDGGEYDDDGAADGVIRDPSGAAIPAIVDTQEESSTIDDLADTGQQIGLMYAIASLLIMAPVVVWLTKKQTKNKI